jgi:hypothetical protein
MFTADSGALVYRLVYSAYTALEIPTIAGY